MNIPAAREAFRSNRFFGSLDGLRALSILGVVWFHAWWGTPYYPMLLRLPVLRQGSYGVEIFFAISGFLITTLLLREEDRFGTISLRDFYMRRALRIWPLYYATIIIYIFAVHFFERGTNSEATYFHYLPYFLTYTYTWFITPAWPTSTFNLAWTLATEEQFYAFWPIALRFLRGAARPALIASLIALKLATMYGILRLLLAPASFPARVINSLSIPIFLGVLLAQALHSERGFRALYRVFGQIWAAPVALCAVALCLWPAQIPVLLADLATVSLVATCVIREDNGLARILRFRPLAYIGVISYGMYLLNSLTLHLVAGPLFRIGVRSPLIIFPVGLAATTGVATLSYRYFETPFLALKSRFTHEERRTPGSKNTNSVQRSVAVQPSNE